jgi:hypothetical protein
VSRRQRGQRIEQSIHQLRVCPQDMAIDVRQPVVL